MFFQHPETEENSPNNQVKQSQSTTASCKILQKQRRRRKKKPNKKNKQLSKELLKKKSRFAATMSSWAESFTVAATWQLKHQVAHWKAKAKALEYENKVLHDVIRKNCLSVPEAADIVSESEPEQCNEEILENEEDEEAFEVSEEFIEFVRANRVFKEDARKEREMFKAKREAEEKLLQEQLQSAPVLEDNTQRLKDLYGDQWQRLGALEMGLQAQFIEETDRERTTYWPVIPFNFNY